jgi:hypothetical protein
MDNQDKLTIEDVDMILTSLDYTKRAFADYKDYPSYEFKQQRIADVEKVIELI